VQAESILKTPLSDEEFDFLEELLEAHSPLDSEGLLGVLHAAAVAPGRITPDQWMELVMPSGFGDLDPQGMQAFLGLVFRVLNEVIETLDSGQTLAPDPDDEDECKSFAAAYAATASLDPLWRDEPARWSLVAPFAYLGEQPDLVSPDDRKRLSKVKNTLAVIREDLTPMILETRADFLPVRQAALDGVLAASTNGAPQPIVAANRVGRNDPCPCRSGKKYKRCCGAVV